MNIGDVNFSYFKCTDFGTLVSTLSFWRSDLDPLKIAHFLKTHLKDDKAVFCLVLLSHQLLFKEKSFNLKKKLDDIF